MRRGQRCGAEGGSQALWGEQVGLVNLPPAQPVKQLKPETLPLEAMQKSPTPLGARLPFLRLGQQAKNSVTFALVGNWKLPAAAITATADKPARDGVAVGQRVGTK